MSWNDECNCGNCNNDDCICICHNLDLLDDDGLKLVLLHENVCITPSGLQQKSRIQLMLMVRETSDPVRIIKTGVKLVQDCIKSASKKASVTHSRSSIRKIKTNSARFQRVLSDDE